MVGRCMQGDLNANHKHGHASEGRSSPTYSSWYGMVQRCTNPNRRYYHRYGGRGITVCDRWLDFRNFLTDMGVKPEGTSLDRIDNDGNYTPENCRWVNQTTQMCNRTNTLWLEIDGIRKPLSEWCSTGTVSPYVVRKRLKRGWSSKDAVYLPLKCATDSRRSFPRNKDGSIKGK